MSKNQKGFALVESLLILIVIGILGGTGWYVWNSRSKSNKSLDNAAKTSTSTKTPTKARANTPTESNVTANWSVYNDDTNNLSFSYPPSWKAAAASYSQQTVILTSPDIKEESREPFGPGTNVTAGNRILLVFQPQAGKSLDEIFSSSLVATSPSTAPKESRRIDGVPAYEYEYSYDAPTARHIMFIKGTQYYVGGLLDGPDISKTSPNYDTFINILNSIVVK